MSRVYLADAFGWDTEYTAKVALAELRRGGILDGGCARKQLVKNSSYRWMPNLLKSLGYIPGIHVIVGVVEIIFSGAFAGSYHRPENQKWWIVRGVVTIVTGPLLLIVDLIKCIADCIIAKKYKEAMRGAMEEFNVTHGHSYPFWPGHPVECLPGEQV